MATNEQQAGYNYMGSYAPRPFNIMDSVSTNPADYANLSGLQGLDLTGIGLGGPYVPPGSTGSTGSTQPPATVEDPRITAAKIAAEQRQREIDAETQRRKDATEGAVKAAFAMYGLSSLFPLIQQWAQQGLTEDAIYLNLRNTEAYKARFPAMAALSERGRAITEAEYVGYEKSAAALEQRYGLPNGMLMGEVTNLLTNEVSIAELNDRVIIASADSLTAPQEVKDALQDYYGVDPDEALRAYYLDPDIAVPLLQKQSAAARIGAQAYRNQVQGVDRALAERLQGMGVTEREAGQGFTRVASQEGLSYGKGDTADTLTLIEANLAGNADAQEALTRASSSRRGRFSGGGTYSGSDKGMAGIGSA